MATREEKRADRAKTAEEARRLYENEGLTLMKVAETLGISYGKTHALVKQAGGSMRKRGGKSKK